jgi:hypothetical protein
MNVDDAEPDTGCATAVIVADGLDRRAREPSKESV